MKSITFITSNKHKLEQIKKHLNLPIEHVGLDLIEIQSVDPFKTAEHKVKEAYQQIKTPVFIEDTSLIFNALGKLPGPFIKWFHDEIGLEGMCRLLDSYEDRSAFVWIIFAYYDGQTVHIFDAKQEGIIPDHPRGENGFGWNPIFIPNGFTKTYAEMSEAEKTETSPRVRATKKLAQYLKDHEN